MSEVVNDVGIPTAPVESAPEAKPQASAETSWDELILDGDSKGQANDISDLDWDNVENHPSNKIPEKEEVKASDDDSGKDNGEGSKDELEVKGEAKEPLDINSLPEDTIIKAKVDGELVEISLKEYKNGISGEKAIAKRFSDFDRKEKEFKSEMNKVNAYIDDLSKTMKESSVLGGVLKIGELTGIPEYQVKEALIRELMPEIERRYSLTETELELELKDNENKYLKSKHESVSKVSEQEQAQKDLNAKILKLREANGIDIDEWDNAVTHLDNTLPKDEPLTPDLVLKYVSFKKAEGRAERVIGQFDAKYSKDDEVIQTLSEVIVDNPSFSDEDLLNILGNSLGKAKTETIVKKVEDRVEAKSKKEENKQEKSLFSPEMKDGKEISDWSDLL